MSRDREGRAYTISQHGFFRRGYVLSDVSRVLDIPEDHLRRAMDSLQIPVLDSFYDDAISEDAVKEIVPNHIEPRRPHKQVIDDWHEYCRMRTFQNFLGMWMFMIREQCERVQVWSGIGDEIPYLLEPHSWPDLTFLDRSKADQSLRCENCQALLYIDIVGNRRRIDRFDPDEREQTFEDIFAPPPMFHKRRGRGAIIEGIDTCRIHTITKKGEKWIISL